MQRDSHPTEKILALTWHVKDTWYGKNYRVILNRDENTGFNTLKEVKQYKSLLALYVNKKYNQKVTGKDTKFDQHGNFPTYIHSIGPSYWCENYYISIAQLEAFKQQYESSSEFQEKKHKAENRKWLKEMRSKRTKKQLATR